MKSLFITLFILSSFTILAQDYNMGFKNLNWGTTLEEVSDQFTKSENKVPPMKGYDKINEDFTFEDITAEMITYGFKKEKFKGVNILIKDEHLNQLIELWTTKYGEPKLTDAGFLKNYEWHLESFRMTISHFPQKDGDANTTIGIMQK
jgi:hypothetical protein